MKALLAIIAALSVPILIVNVFGGIASGIWLAFLGEWKAIGVGIVLLLIATVLIGFAALPTLIFIAPGVKLLEKGHKISGYFLSGLGSLYWSAVMIGWASFILFYFQRMAGSSSLIPLLVWSYGIATGPWSRLAQKDFKERGESSTAHVPVGFLSLGYLVVIVMRLTTDISLYASIWILAVAVLISSIVTVLMTSASTQIHQQQFDPMNETEGARRRRLIAEMDSGEQAVDGNPH
jgi:hypothetical protein